MKDTQRVDAISGFFVATIINGRPTRGEMAELLRGMKDLKKRLHPEDYRELSKRARTIVDIEIKWRKRKDWEREMATMWGCNAN